MVACGYRTLVISERVRPPVVSLLDLALFYRQPLLGSVEERFGGFNDAINECGRMKNGIASDVVFDVLKIIRSGQRPADLRHRAILFFSSS